MRSRTVAALALGISLACGARAEESAQRLDAICATTFEARVEFRLGGIPIQDAVDGATILRTRLHDYALLGYPPDAPLDATMSTIDGRTLTYLAPITQGLALVRADRSALPLLADVQEAAYSALMTLPVEEFRKCDTLGIEVQQRADHLLLAHEEALAARCGSIFSSGPENGFLCSAGRLAFVRFFDAEYFLTDTIALPSAHLGTGAADALGDPITYRLGTPVFDADDGRRIGFLSTVAGARVHVVPAENIVPHAMDIATRSETP